MKVALLSCFTGSTLGPGRSYGPATIQSFLTESAASGLRSGELNDIVRLDRWVIPRQVHCPEGSEIVQMSSERALCRRRRDILQKLGLANRDGTAAVVQEQCTENGDPRRCTSVEVEGQTMSIIAPNRVAEKRDVHWSRACAQAVGLFVRGIIIKKDIIARFREKCWTYRSA